jgi:hypothetical protein
MGSDTFNVGKTVGRAGSRASQKVMQSPPATAVRQWVERGHQARAQARMANQVDGLLAAGDEHGMRPMSSGSGTASGGEQPGTGNEDAVAETSGTGGDEAEIAVPEDEEGRNAGEFEREAQENTGGEDSRG